MAFCCTSCTSAFVLRKSYVGRGFITISPKKRKWIELIFTFLLIGILFYIGIIIILRSPIIQTHLNNLDSIDSSPNEKLNLTKITDESDDDDDDNDDDILFGLIWICSFWIINLVWLSIFLGFFGMCHFKLFGHCSKISKTGR